MVSKLKFYQKSSAKWRLENNLDSLEWDEYRNNLIFGAWLHITANTILALIVGTQIGINLV